MSKYMFGNTPYFLDFELDIEQSKESLIKWIEEEIRINLEITFKNSQLNKLPLSVNWND